MRTRYNFRKAIVINKRLLILTLAILTSFVANAQYCTPTVNKKGNFGIGISKVQIGSINNNTGTPSASKVYTDFSGSMSVTLQACQAQTFNITVGNSNNTQAGIFVDWNKDNVFSNPSELVAYSGAVTPIEANQVFSGSFSVPAGQAAGTYRLRVAGDFGGSGTVIQPCALAYSGDVEDYSLLVTSPSGTDLSVIGLFSPAVFIQGNNTLTIRVQNLGATSINTATVGYDFQGSGPVTQTVNFSTPLPSCAIADVPVSTALNIAASGFYTLKLWATSPNGNPDSQISNDTINISICTPLSGTYTIDQSGSGNFTTFTAAAKALKTCGMSGPVTINVAAGKYNEQISLSGIAGLSSSNTLTIDGGDGNAGSRILTADNSGNKTRHTLMLDNISHISIKNITIRNVSQAYGYNLFFYGTTSDINIINCRIDYAGGPGANSATPNFIPVVFSNSLSSSGTAASFSRIRLDSNNINGGFTGISAYGKGTANTECVFTNNVLENSYQYGMFFNNMNGVICNGNTITTNRANSSGYGIYFSGVNASAAYLSEICRNRISATQYGIYVASSSNSGKDGLLANNMIGGGFLSSSPYGIYFRSNNKWNIVYNSVNVDAAITGTPGPSALYMSGGSLNDVINNHLILSDLSLNNGNVFPLYILSGASVVDYNNYFKNGTRTNFILVNGKVYSGIDYKGGGGFNTNSLSVNPSFVSSMDLHSRNGCATGITLSYVTSDFDGSIRNTPPAIGADESVTLDASAIAILAPSVTVVSGLQNVVFTAKNTGRIPITSLTAGYTLNGGTAVTQPWTGTMNPCDSVTFTFTAVQAASFPISGINRLSVFVRNPNGSADQEPLNDTTSRSYCKGPLSGVYTINPAGGTVNTFPSISSLVASLNSCGMSGNITVNVANGIYIEQFIISSTITGLAGKTITFNGGDSSKTKITFYGGGYTLKLDGADNITFRNIAIENTAPSNGKAVWLTNAADSNIFESCIITTPSVNNNTVISFSVMGATFGAGGNWGNKNILRRSVVTGGFISVNLYGTSAVVKSTGNRITDNVIRGGMQNGFNCYYQTAIDFIGNTVTGIQSPAAAVKIYYSDIARIQRNSVYDVSSSIGFDFGYLNQNGGASRSIVENNMIAGPGSTGTMYGIYLTNPVNTDIFHNSVYLASSSSTSGSAAYISGGNGNSVRNNIFASDLPGGFAFSSDTAGLTSFNYNNFYSAGVFLAKVSAVNVSNLANLKALNTAHNANSVSVNPAFVNKNAGAYDLHLMQNQASPLADPSVSTTVDFDGDLRCALAKTMGADESKFINPVSVLFTTADTVYANSSFAATNNAIAGSLQTYQWDFNNDGSIEATTLNAVFTFTSPGIKQIKLRASNCSTSDSIVKTVVVINPNGSPVADFSINKIVFTPFENVLLQDLSTNAPTSWLWEITPVDSFMTANPGLTSKNPSLIFTTPAIYSVCLTATNSAGSSAKKCKTAFFTVKDVSNMCIFPNSSQAPFGEFYDSGGPTVNYTTNEVCSYLIEPCALSVTLKFSQFTLGASAHYLRIYNGRDNTAPLMGTFTSAGGLPGGVNGVTANSGAMYLEWSSVGSASVAAGYAAEWSIVANPNPVVIPDFDMPDSAFELSNVSFINTSTGTGLSYSWDLDGDLFPDAGTKDAIFAYPSAGTYYPTLTVSDACGNVLTKKDTIIIVVPSIAPVVDFKADITAVTKTDTVKFTDLSTYGPYAWTYTFNPAYARIVGGTAQNPFVIFDSSGAYSVTLVATNNVGSGTLTKTNYISRVTVCIPAMSGGMVPDIGINRVILKEINNASASGSSPFTSYFSNVAPAVLDAGGTYDISVFRNSTLNKVNRKVWIDYNSDGDFADAGELVGSEAAALTQSWKHTFTVPAAAKRGATRMRVGAAFNDSTNQACGPNFYGEIEEYRVVITDDITAPVITLKGSDTVVFELGSLYTDSGATAFDAVNGVLLPVVTNNVNANIAGTYQYRYNVTDLSGNKAVEVVRTVIVSPDATPPLLTLFAPLIITMPLYEKFTEPGYTAIDAVSGNVTAQVVADYSTLDTANVGTYLIKYTAYDAMNNTDVRYRTVHVVDITAPVIIIDGPNPIEVEVFTPFFDPGARAYDDYDQLLTVNANGNVDANSVGSYTITYSAKDASGNIATAQRTVNVVDRTSPVLELFAGDTIFVEVHTSFTNPLVTATDNYDPDPVISTLGSYNLSLLGAYQLKYIAADASGNQSLYDSVVIKVVDTQKPVISLRGPYLMKVQQWMAFVDSGVKVDDNYYKNLEPSVVKGGDFNSTVVLGLYYITYNVTDPSGNVADEVIRAVQVIENTTGIKDISGEMAVNVYPNPASDAVTVELQNSGFVNGRIEIVSMLGKIVESVTPLEFSSIQKIETGGLASGIYLLHVVSNGEVSLKRLIISR